MEVLITIRKNASTLRNEPPQMYALPPFWSQSIKDILDYRLSFNSTGIRRVHTQYKNHNNSHYDNAYPFQARSRSYTVQLTACIRIICAPIIGHQQNNSIMILKPTTTQNLSSLTNRSVKISIAIVKNTYLLSQSRIILIAQSKAPAKSCKILPTRLTRNCILIISTP